MKFSQSVIAKTKILATLGPKTESSAIIKKLINVGIDGVRFNMSHGDYDFYSRLFDSINNVCIDLGSPLAIFKVPRSESVN